MKISYGIACTRFNEASKKYEVLLVKKRYTYSYIDFVLGNISYKNKSFLKKELSKMTIEEKNMILSHNYEMMYYHAFLLKKTDLNEFNLKLFEKTENKFYKNFTYHDLRVLMNGTTYKDTVWEYPKGKITGNEKSLDCAVREFEEETGFKEKDYYIRNTDTVNYIFNDDGVTYKYVLYLAVTDKDIDHHFKFNYEVSNVEWFDSIKAKVLLSNEQYLNLKKIIKLSKNFLR